MEIIFLPLHLASLTFVAWNVFHADHLGFKWMKGSIKKLDAAKVAKYHKNTWIGLGLMIVTGFSLFYPNRAEYLARWQFALKMAFVLALFCNSFIIGYLKNVAVENTFEELPFSKKLPLFISGAISTCAWIGAAMVAFFISAE